MKNQRIVVAIYTEDRRSMRDEVHYTNRVLSEKDFKKWYNHIFREVMRDANVDLVDVFAMYEDQVGDTCELANYWGYQTMKFDPAIPFS